jgi:hypothetical protein
MSHDPTGSPVTAPAGTPSTRHQRRRAVVALIVVVGLATLATGWWLLGPDLDAAGPDEPAAATEAPTSAARGPEGTRSFDGVPDELPGTVVTPDAREVIGTVSRGGDDWSASLLYVVEGSERDAVEVAVDAALVSEGFVRRRVSSDPERKVVVYDRPDRATLTLTLLLQPDGVSVGLVLISPQ